MTIRQIKKLRSGDEVFWNDPDTSANCSRIYVISSIKVENGMVQIWDKDGSYLECWPEELC